MTKELTVIEPTAPNKDLLKIDKQEESGLTPFQEKLIEYAPKAETFREAALMAGYAESTAKNIWSIVSRSKKFIDRWNETFGKHAASKNLPVVNSIDEITLKLAQRAGKKVLDNKQASQEEIKQGLDILSKSEHTRKRVDQKAGVLAADDEHSKPIMINIKKLQMMLRHVGNED